MSMAENDDKTAGLLSIPLIDFDVFFKGQAGPRQLLGRRLVGALHDYGFFYLKNHGIPYHMVENVFELSHEFFSLSEESKELVKWTSPESNRGYAKVGREHVASFSVNKSTLSNFQDVIEDNKETYQIGRENQPDYANNWPQSLESPENFKFTCLKFFDVCQNLHIMIMRAIALGLNLDENYFDPYIDDSDNTLRLLHYPPVACDWFHDASDPIRAGAHTDYGSVTFLFQDSIGGLQVYSPSGQFVDVAPIPNTIVVNAGDLLARWSNDTIKSTLHRVVIPGNQSSQSNKSTESPHDPSKKKKKSLSSSNKDGGMFPPQLPPGAGEPLCPARYSIAYFCHPNFSSTISAIPGTYDDGRHYKDVNSRDYLLSRLQDTYN